MKQKEVLEQVAILVPPMDPGGAKCPVMPPVEPPKEERKPRLGVMEYAAVEALARELGDKPWLIDITCDPGSKIITVRVDLDKAAKAKAKTTWAKQIPKEIQGYKVVGVGETPKKKARRKNVKSEG